SITDWPARTHKRDRCVCVPAEKQVVLMKTRRSGQAHTHRSNLRRGMPDCFKARSIIERNQSTVLDLRERERERERTGAQRPIQHCWKLRGWISAKRWIFR